MDDDSTKGEEIIPAYQDPDEEEKAAILKRHGLSEEMYEMYYEMHKEGWYYRGGYKANITLDEYIEMMEGQRLAHENKQSQLPDKNDGT